MGIPKTSIRNNPVSIFAICNLLYNQSLSLIERFMAEKSQFPQVKQKTNIIQ